MRKVDKMKKTADKLLDEIMVECGFRAHLAGTALVREAVEMYTDGMRIYKEVYPALAKRHGKTVAQVERNMRAAVVAAFDNGAMTEDARQYFRYCSSERPTVGEVVARLRRVLDINMRIENAN